MKGWTRVILGWVILGWIVFGAADLWAVRRAGQIERDLIQKKKALKDIKKEISVTRKKEKKIKGDESSILGGLHSLENELYKKEKELNHMESQLAKTRERLQQTENQITLLSQGMEQTKGKLSSRLVALYKMGKTQPETFLLTSQSYPDLLRLDKYLKVIIDFDRQLTETFRRQMVLKEKYQEELAQDQFQWQRNISEVEKKKEEIRKVQQRKQAFLKAIQNQKEVYQNLIGELEGRARKLQTLVNKVEQGKSLLAHKGSKYEIPEERLISPVDGRVISLFKEKGQNGIEIKAPMGAEIRAVLPGKVLYADWFKGFGNVMIIDHGNRTFTVSGYCSQLLKKTGDIVSKGEAIALVGSAGSLKGPCLYFEIRYGGKPQDPLNWIPNPGKVVSLPKESLIEEKKE